MLYPSKPRPYGLLNRVDVDPAVDCEPATVVNVWFQVAVAHNGTDAWAIQ